MSRGSQRAVGATVVFATFGAWCAAFQVPDWSVSAPLVISYGVLVLNTYCSIRCFSSITPPANGAQGAFDLVLAALYIALASSFADPIRFTAAATLLFGVATLKYVALVGLPFPSVLLERKIRLDALGTTACAGALAAMTAGLEDEASWALAAVNVAANFYVLWWNPLYRVGVRPNARPPSYSDALSRALPR